jgi:hypothetical protein
MSTRAIHVPLSWITSMSWSISYAELRNDLLFTEKKKLQRHLQLQLKVQLDEKWNWSNARLPCNQGGSIKDAARPAAVLAWKVIGLALRMGLRCHVISRGPAGAWHIVYRDVATALWPPVLNGAVHSVSDWVGWTPEGQLISAEVHVGDPMGYGLRMECSLSVVGGSCSPVGYYEPILVAVAFKGGM